MGRAQLRQNNRQPVIDEQAKADADVTAALVALARLLGRQAARDDHAAALKQEEKSDAEDRQNT
jgi:hypothetical protein